MDPLSRLRLAYIITIHKSQGSEWDTIVLPVSKGFSHMLHRNLLYTAISRARKRVVIVGDPDALSMALQRETPPFAHWFLYSLLLTIYTVSRVHNCISNITERRWGKTRGLVRRT